MEFKTHQEIDEHFINSGKLTRENINRLHKEEFAVGILLDKSWNDAKLFLKKKVGKVGYFFLAIINFELIPPLGREFWFEREAKKRGWKNTFEYPKDYTFEGEKE